MAIAVVMDFPSITQVQYETARRLLGATPPAGQVVHIAGPLEDGWRVLEVWESPADMQHFFGSAAAQEVFQAAGIPPAQPTVFPVHTLFASSAAVTPAEQ